MSIRWNAVRILVAAGLLMSPQLSSAQPLADAVLQPGFDDQAAAEREQAAAEREAARKERERDREDRDYEAAQRLLEKAQWLQAAERFSTVAALKGGRADAALYWKAYALDKVGQKAEALATAAELIKGFPSSRWMSDAKALEIQVRQSVGQPVRPEGEADEELKLLAIQGLQHTDPEQAIPMLEKILQGPQSPRLKERALFVAGAKQLAAGASGAGRSRQRLG